MNALIVYDSYFGNTEKVALVIAEVLAENFETQTINLKEYLEIPPHMPGLLVIGSPTRAFSATKAVNSYINRLRKNELQGVRCAVFDTRVDKHDINSRIVGKMMSTFGYAAGPMAKKLKKKGATLIVPPEGFYVEDTEGPLKEGEPERAKEWARGLLSKLHAEK